MNDETDITRYEAYPISRLEVNDLEDILESNELPAVLESLILICEENAEIASWLVKSDGQTTATWDTWSRALRAAQQNLAMSKAQAQVRAGVRT